MHINFFIIREFTKKRKDKQNVKRKWMMKTKKGLWREAGEEECTFFDELAAPSRDTVPELNYQTVRQPAIPDLERKRRRDSSSGGVGESTGDEK